MGVRRAPHAKYVFDYKAASAATVSAATIATASAAAASAPPKSPIVANATKGPIVPGIVSYTYLFYFSITVCVVTYDFIAFVAQRLKSPPARAVANAAAAEAKVGVAEVKKREAMCEV